MQRIFLSLACALLLAAVDASAQQLVSVDPGEVLVDTGSGFDARISWRIASRGGAASPRGVFVNLDNNRELGAVDRILEVRGDRGVATEQVRLSAAQLRQWSRQGVRRIGYRRIFAGAAGSLANRVEIDIAGGRLAAVSAAPAQQTLSSQSRSMMLRWDLRGDTGGVSAHSGSGQFLLGDEVIYEVVQPLSSDGGSIRESVELPPGLVQELLDQGIYQLRYSRTFVDDGDRKRSASVALNLAQ